MRLIDYSSDTHCFEFDPETRAYSHVELPASRTDRLGYSGAAQLLRSPGEGRVLVAKYVFSGDAWFSIGTEKWRMLDGLVAVKHRELLGVFLCRLALYQGETCIRTFRYFRRDWLAAIIDPAYDELDFSLANLPVDLEPHDLSSIQKQREDFIAIWSNPPGSDK